MKVLAIALVAALLVGLAVARPGGKKGKKGGVPDGACAAGCEGEQICRQDKTAGCKKKEYSTNADCWSCQDAPGSGKKGKKNKDKVKDDSKQNKTKVEVPETACNGGCDAEQECRVDKAAGCEEAEVGTNANCWSCQASGKKKKNKNADGAGKQNKTRVESPEDVCNGGCEEGLVCRPNKEAGCKKGNIGTNADCWSCQAPAKSKGKGKGKKGDADTEGQETEEKVKGKGGNKGGKKGKKGKGGAQTDDSDSGSDAGSEGATDVGAPAKNGGKNGGGKGKGKKGKGGR